MFPLRGAFRHFSEFRREKLRDLNSVFGLKTVTWSGGRLISSPDKTKERAAPPAADVQAGTERRLVVGCFYG